MFTRLKCSLNGDTCNWIGLPNPDKKRSIETWVPPLEMKIKFIHGFLQSPPQLILQLYIFCQGFWVLWLNSDKAGKENTKENTFFGALIYLLILSIGSNLCSVISSSIDYLYQDIDRVMSEPIGQVSSGLC